MLIKLAQTVSIHLGHFCKKLCHRELPKIAQSCHTGRPPVPVVEYVFWDKIKVDRNDFLPGGTAINPDFDSIVTSSKIGR